MQIYIIPFIICLALAGVPFLIQLLVCIATKKMWVRLIPAIISAALCASFFIPYLNDGDSIGNAFERVILLSTCAALVIAHGVPFLIYSHEK